jgi:2-dehydropantoate 2-reductase
LSTKVLVVGAGAIGAFYAAVLARAGCEVSVVARSDYDVVSRDGYVVDSVLGDLSFRPAQVLRNAGEWQGEAEFVFVALKHVRGTDRAALIRPAVSAKTAIVLVQNGIDVEQEVVDAFPGNELVSGIAYAAASREAPGHIRHHSKFTRLVVGNYPSGTSATTAKVAALVKQGGGSCVETGDIVGARWQKCTWNTVFNPVSALGGGLGTGAILGSDAGREFVREAIREVCAVAKAAGHPLAEDTAETQVAGTLRMGDYVSSMGQDYLAGRPMEIEPLIGNAVRIAQRLSVPVPRLQGLYAMLLMLEQKGVH